MNNEPSKSVIVAAHVAAGAAVLMLVAPIAVAFVPLFIWNIPTALEKIAANKKNPGP